MNYIFDLFGTLVKIDLERYMEIMAGSFGLNDAEYNKKLRVYVSTNDFSSREEALNSI